jgi:hypothetical protein
MMAHWYYDTPNADKSLLTIKSAGAANPAEFGNNIDAKSCLEIFLAWPKGNKYKLLLVKENTPHSQTVLFAALLQLGIQIIIVLHSHSAKRLGIHI